MNKEEFQESYKVVKDVCKKTLKDLDFGMLEATDDQLIDLSLLSVLKSVSEIKEDVRLVALVVAIVRLELENLVLKHQNSTLLNTISILQSKNEKH